MSDDSSLAGSVAVVAGGSRGIGAAVARRLAELGAAVVVNGRDRATVEATVSQLRSNAGRATGVVGPMEQDSVATELIQVAENEFGPVDVAINCAGVAEPPGSSVLSVSSADWNRLIDAHLTSAFQLCRAVAPGMVERKAGSIVLTGSHAFPGLYGGTGYPAGKGGVVSLTYALAAELREHDVRVNAVCPGARTRLSTGPEYEANIRSLHERGLLDDLMLAGSLEPSDPDYAAALYAFLAHPASGHLTGEILVAASGYIGRIQRPTESLVAYRGTDQPPYTLDELASLLLDDGPSTAEARH